MKIHKRSIIFGIVVGIILLTATWYFTRPQGMIEFALAPGEMQMQNGEQTQTVTHKQKITLSPGTYELVFSRDDFSQVERKITIEKGETYRIVIALTPQTDAAQQILRDSPDFQAVIDEFKKTQYETLIATLPISGVGYNISACQSLLKPKAGNKAICIGVESPAGEQAARKELTRLSYNIDDLELLVGTENIKTIIKNDRFTVDYYTQVDSEHSDKPALFVTPLTAPFVAFGAPFNAELEAIRTDALAAIKNKGYELSELDIFYSNVYLSKYNPAANESAEHAMPPVQP